MKELSKNIQTVGRRKEAIARVRLREGNGQISIDGKPISEVFKGMVYQIAYQRPFVATKTLGKYTATVKVSGGGISSRLGAIVYGLSKALAQISPEHKVALRKQGLLTRDPRVKERRKYGLAHKARAKKQSPKR